jgi:hypothetical protein
MHPIDLEQFRASRADKPQPAKPQRPPRHRAGDWFLKGPIPGAWLTRVFAMPTRTSGRALRVGLALWYLVGVKKSRAVKPTWDTWQRFRLSPLCRAPGVGCAGRRRVGGCRSAPGLLPHRDDPRQESTLAQPTIRTYDAGGCDRFFPATRSGGCPYPARASQTHTSAELTTPPPE